eukprot:9354771-Karenia_brevis.AAC.1
MEDPSDDMWGKLVEAISVPKGDQGQPPFNQIYTDHVCPPKDPPPGGWVDRLRGRDLIKKEEAKAKAQAQRARSVGTPAGGTASPNQS